jgi:hypothetical protein
MKIILEQVLRYNRENPIVSALESFQDSSSFLGSANYVRGGSLPFNLTI